MSNAPRKPPRELDITDDKKMMLWGTPLVADAFPIRGKFAIDKDDNQIVFEVDSGTKTEKGFPINVQMPMALPNFKLFMNLIRKVGSFKGAVAFEIDIKGHPWIYNREQGKNIKSKEALLVGRVVVEKRENGLTQLLVTAPKKPEMRFEFKPNDYMTVAQNGAEVPLSFTSGEVAIAWAEGWSDVLTQKLASDWKEPEHQRTWRLQRAAENAQRHSGQGQGQRPPQQPQQSAPAAQPQTQVGSDVFDDVFF